MRVTLRSKWLRTFTAAALLLLGNLVVAQIPPREVATPESQISDHFIAYLHALVYKNLELDIDGDTLRERFPDFDTSEDFGAAWKSISQR